MPLLNLGYALGGLTGGYNQAQTQAMQRAAYQLALQQAQSQMTGQRLANQYLLSGGKLGGGGLGGLGGGFNPQNINPISQPAPAPIPGVTTPSQAPAPPVAQQPPSASSPSNGSGVGFSPDPAYDPFALPGAVAPSQAETPDSSLKNPETIPLDTPSNGQTKPATSAPPVTTTPDTKPAPGPASDTKPSTTTPSATTAPASTTSDASGGTSGGDSYAVKIPGGPSIPLSTFFDTIDYSHLAQGIAKIAPPGTDQADIYQAVVDLSKLAEGNRTQQQQAGLILRELIKQPFDLEKIHARGEEARTTAGVNIEGRKEVAGIQQAGATGRTEANIASREKIAAAHDQTKRDIAAANQELRRSAQTSLDAYRQSQLNNQVQRLQQSAEALGLRYQSAQLSAIRARISTFKPAGQGGLTFTEDQQKQLAALNARAAAIGEQIAAQAATAAPAQQ